MVTQDTGLTSDYFERRFKELNTSQHEQVGGAKCPAVLPLLPGCPAAEPGPLGRLTSTSGHPAMGSLRGVTCSSREPATAGSSVMH